MTTDDQGPGDDRIGGSDELPAGGESVEDPGERSITPHVAEEVQIWGSTRPPDDAAPAAAPTAVRSPADDVRRPPTRHSRSSSSRRRRSRRPRGRSRSRAARRPRVSLVRKFQRAWHEHPVRTRLVLLISALAIASLVIVGDAYWQTYHAYADMRQAIPKIQQAKGALTKGKIPAPEVFDAVTAAASRATYDVDHTDFAFRLVGSIPGLNRPIEAARWAATAADQESQAITNLRDLISDVLGDRALQSGDVQKATLPIYKDGAINVELLDSLAPRLTRLIGHLEAGEVAIRHIPSVPFFGKVDRLKAQALDGSQRAVSLIQHGLSGVRLLPSFLGAHGSRTYFVALQNSVDQRGTGGAVLAYALVRMDHGRLQLLHGGGINEIDDNRKGVPVRSVPAGVRWYLGKTGTPPRINNGANYSPDFPIVAATWTRMVERATGVHVDGAMALDPFAISAMLRGQGQMKIPAFPGRIDSDNVVQLVGHQQFSLPRQDQVDLPGQLIQKAFQKIEHPKDFFKMANGLGKAIPGRHVQVWAADPKEEALVKQLGWDGGLSESKGDFLALAYEKRIAGKQDYWTKHALDYDVTVHASGAVDSTYTVHVADDIPPGAPGRMIPHAHPYGVNVAMYNLYVPGRARFDSVSPSYQAFPTGFVSPSHYVAYVRPRGFEQHVEGRYRVFTQTVTPYPGHPKTVRFTYSIPGVVQRTPDGNVYRLTVNVQPLFLPASMNITVHLPKGADVSSTAPGWRVQGNQLTLHIDELSGDFSTKIVF
jgi:Protein of unknown function (DUF4012)